MTRIKEANGASRFSSSALLNESDYELPSALLWSTTLGRRQPAGPAIFATKVSSNCPSRIVRIVPERRGVGASRKLGSHGRGPYVRSFMTVSSHRGQSYPHTEASRRLQNQWQKKHQICITAESNDRAMAEVLRWNVLWGSRFVKSTNR